jgi:hypothetical protein
VNSGKLIASLGWPGFGLLVILAGLGLLMTANVAAPGCTGPTVERCDYVETAKHAIATRSPYPAQRDLGFEVYDQGSSVMVQQWTPAGEPSLNHASSVFIDKRSCRVCRLDWQMPTRADPRDPHPGALILRTPAEDRVGAAKRADYWRGGPGGISPL